MEMDKEFTNDDEIKSEIINLSAILKLPKGTEAHVSDIHGHDEKYSNIIRSGAGNISRKVSELFNGQLTTINQKKLVSLIYYPEEILKKVIAEFNEDNDKEQWYFGTINELIQILRYVSNKHPEHIINEALDKKFKDLVKELIFNDLNAEDKRQYYQEIVKGLIKLNVSNDFILVICHAIQKLAIERIHILGDVYDFGPHPDLIIKQLGNSWQNFDFEWGNHDVLWMGSVAGSKLCMLNLIRISARYHNLGLLENVYGIDLTSLIRYALNRYISLPNFEPKVVVDGESDDERNIDNCVQQAAAIMQFKLEGQAIKRRPEFKMDDRLFLDKLSSDRKKVTIDGKSYSIENGCFQTVNPAKPYQITNSERVVLIDLINQFTQSKKLNQDMRFMANNGSMYAKHNDNLLFHGCIPVDNQGNFVEMTLDGQRYSGKELSDYFEFILKDGLRHPTTGDCWNSDVIWYLWEGANSPLFAKDKMRTFERYFISDDKLQQEHHNPFFKLSHEEWFVDKVLKEFGLGRRGHIINGHTPAKEVPPVRANQKFIMVNGMSESKVGADVKNYALLIDSYGMLLETLKPFTSREEVIKYMADITEDRDVVEYSSERKTIGDTEYGEDIKKQIEFLSARLDD